MKSEQQQQEREQWQTKQQQNVASIAELSWRCALSKGVTDRCFDTNDEDDTPTAQLLFCSPKSLTLSLNAFEVNLQEKKEEYTGIVTDAHTIEVFDGHTIVRKIVVEGGSLDAREGYKVINYPLRADKLLITGGKVNEHMC